MQSESIGECLELGGELTVRYGRRKVKARRRTGAKTVSVWEAPPVCSDPLGGSVARSPGFAGFETLRLAGGSRQSINTTNEQTSCCPV
jgi:hypothetical protein